MQILFISNRTKTYGIGLTILLTGTLSAQGPEPGPQAEVDIRELIENLSHAEFPIRTEATRRLCAVGEPARDSLQTAVTGSDREAALRAKSVLDALDQVLFAGVSVHLEADRTSFSWKEPVEIRVVLENRTPFAARLPFPVKSERSEASPDAGQVSAMIDVSDWLQVRSPRGQEIDLRIDEISDDPAVLRAVEDRLRSNQLHELPPGGRSVLSLTGFNRGWARYPLLDRGEYRINFQYLPQWSDPVLTGQRTGEVLSNVVTLNVEDGAQLQVSREGVQAELKLRRTDGDLVVELVNRHDQAALINTNFGKSLPFAEIEWILERDGRRHILSASENPGRSWSDFSSRGLVQVEAGESLELMRTGVRELAQAFGVIGAPPITAGGTITFSYSNVCSRRWQVREQGSLDKDPATPAVLRMPLPRQLLAIRLTSSAIEVAGQP